jgi:hypothetical protein
MLPIAIAAACLPGLYFCNPGAVYLRFGSRCASVSRRCAVALLFVVKKTMAPTHLFFSPLFPIPPRYHRGPHKNHATVKSSHQAGSRARDPRGKSPGAAALRTLLKSVLSRQRADMFIVFFFFAMWQVRSRMKGSERPGKTNLDVLAAKTETASTRRLGIPYLCLVRGRARQSNIISVPFGAAWLGQIPMLVSAALAPLWMVLGCLRP